MDRSMPYLIIAMVGIALVVYLMIVDRRRIYLQRLKVKKMYASPMFEAMRTMLKQAQKYSIESLAIDKTGFTIHFLFPFGYQTRFNVADFGYPNLTLDKQETMLLLLEDLLPKLTANGCYSFRSIRNRLLDGHVEYQYKYLIQIDYKNMLTRAPYYNGSLQSQLW